jgi:hypothetical protein
MHICCQIHSCYPLIAEFVRVVRFSRSLSPLDIVNGKTCQRWQCSSPSGLTSSTKVRCRTSKQTRLTTEQSLASTPFHQCAITALLSAQDAILRPTLSPVRHPHGRSADVSHSVLKYLVQSILALTIRQSDRQNRF